ncbi:hypothetical protein PoB_002348400 [Plakobranchus ocellatus]|uniref:Uncharacterized protein n=1 Tax=Plakobranchus ocellatus TaxID=259542 RepID=A0AAV3ZRE2_9GAST|nr:hypothetical protein PoB_002348400 [Plakobranchus ocellatus]
MDKLKEDVRTQKPDKLYREADVLYGPKKKRVIYDAKHRGKETGMNMQTVRTGTFADQHIALEFADSPNPVLGSDEEKAMRNAMAFAFPDAGILTCNRHLRGNCVNYLTDKIGVPHGPKMRLLWLFIQLSKEIERSLIGRGHLMLQEQFLRFRMTADAWQALPDGKRKKHMSRFTKRIRDANLQVSRGWK